MTTPEAAKEGDQPIGSLKEIQDILKDPTNAQEFSDGFAPILEQEFQWEEGMKTINDLLSKLYVLDASQLSNESKEALAADKEWLQLLKAFLDECGKKIR